MRNASKLDVDCLYSGHYCYIMNVAFAKKSLGWYIQSAYQRVYPVWEHGVSTYC